MRPAPVGWDWAKTVEDAISLVLYWEDQGEEIELISTDHDAGDCGPPDYIKFLDWLEETGRNYPIRIHSMNIVGVANMRAIIERNGWKEVF